MNLVRMSPERGSTENADSSPEDLVSHRTAPFLALKIQSKPECSLGGTSSSGASDGGVVRSGIPYEQTPGSAHGGVMRFEQEN
jgi:hypothetical protein